MTELDFESLKNIKVPEERLSATELALQSAMSEFDLKQKQKSKTIRSLISKINPVPFLGQLPRSIATSGALASITVVALASTIFIYNPLTPQTPSHSEGEMNDAIQAPQEKTKKQQLKKNTLPTPETKINQPALVQEREITTPPPKAKIKPRRRSRPGIGNNNIGIGSSNSQGFNRTAPLSSQQKVRARAFKAPQWKKHALHYCMTQNSQCGKPVADQYCRSRGYGNSGAAPESKSRPAKTASIKNNQIFENTTVQPARTFQYITCINPIKKKP